MRYCFCLHRPTAEGGRVWFVFVGPTTVAGQWLLDGLLSTYGLNVVQAQDLSIIVLLHDF